MRTLRTKQEQSDDALVEESQLENIKRSIHVRGTPNSNPNPPISIRLSEPLLERLDRIAAAQHRRRSNLIQHILWEYVHAHKDDAERKE